MAHEVAAREDTMKFISNCCSDRVYCELLNFS